MSIKLKCLEELVGKKISILNNDFEVIMNSKDSRENTLFIAINKGNDFAKEAEGKGSFVIYDKKELEIVNGYYVEDTVKFMQKFAKKYREEKDFKVIAITGSNGKTTTKDILYTVLKLKGEKVYKTQGNYNNHIGLPFTILSASDKDDILLLEMGMSALGEIDLLGSIATPNYSIITNIGQSHLENLKTMDNVFKAKTEIIKHTKEYIVVNSEDEYLKEINLNNVILSKIENIETNLYGKHNQINLSLVNTLLNKIGYKDLDYRNIIITSGRYEVLEKKYRYINDAYNASPISMKAALETFSEMYNEDFKIIVLGDMLELGENEIKYHEELLETIEKTNFDVLMLYGFRMRYLYNKLRKYNVLKLANNVEERYSLCHYSDKETIKKDIDKIKTLKNKTILLKASRSMKLEDIIE